MQIETGPAEPTCRLQANGVLVPAAADDPTSSPAIAQFYAIQTAAWPVGVETELWTGYGDHPPKRGTGEPRPAFLWIIGLINRSAEPPHVESLSTSGSSISGRSGRSCGSRSRARKRAPRLRRGSGRAEIFSAARQSASSAGETSASNRAAAPCRSRATRAPSRCGPRK